MIEVNRTTLPVLTANILAKMIAESQAQTEGAMSSLAYDLQKLCFADFKLFQNVRKQIRAYCLGRVHWDGCPAAICVMV